MKTAVQLHQGFQRLTLYTKEERKSKVVEKQSVFLYQDVDVSLHSVGGAALIRYTTVPSPPPSSVKQTCQSFLTPSEVFTSNDRSIFTALFLLTSISHLQWYIDSDDTTRHSHTVVECNYVVVHLQVHLLKYCTTIQI